MANKVMTADRRGQKPRMHSLHASSAWPSVLRWRGIALAAASALFIAVAAGNAGLHYGRQDALPAEEALAVPVSPIEPVRGPARRVGTGRICMPSGQSILYSCVR